MSYSSDVTDSDWAVLELFLVRRKRRGPKHKTPLRQVINGIFYRVRTGCQWRMLPREFGDWRVISAYWYRWSHNGMWERINTELREKVREQSGKYAQPTAAIIDSQSVKTVQKGDNAATTRAKTPREENAI